MRLLAWNIRQGGGSRLPRIAEALKRHDAEIVVLSEYRGGPSARRLYGALHSLGYRHATTVLPPPGRNGVLVAARRPFREHGAVGVGLPEPYRMVSVDFDTFQLIGVYMPNLLAKIPYWEALITALSLQSPNRVLAIGDFNTCRAYVDEAGAIDATAHYMDAIEQIGFRDLWRHRHPHQREYSWFSTRNNGFRIDHAFLSHELAACAGSVHYSHEERIAGLSDHSPLILELADDRPAGYGEETTASVASPGEDLATWHPSQLTTCLSMTGSRQMIAMGQAQLLAETCAYGEVAPKAVVDRTATHSDADQNAPPDNVADQLRADPLLPVLYYGSSPGT